LGNQLIFGVSEGLLSVFLASSFRLYARVDGGLLTIGDESRGVREMDLNVLETQKRFPRGE
jgi:hypothetical protein